MQWIIATSQTLEIHTMRLHFLQLQRVDSIVVQALASCFCRGSFASHAVCTVFHDSLISKQLVSLYIQISRGYLPRNRIAVETVTV